LINVSPPFENHIISYHSKTYIKKQSIIHIGTSLAVYVWKKTQLPYQQNGNVRTPIKANHLKRWGAKLMA